MSAVVYAFAAVIVATLATRAWLLDRDAPAHRAFMGLGWSLFLGWLSFALSLLPGAGVWRAGWTLGSLMAPAFAWWTVDALFARPRRDPSRGGRLSRAAFLGGALLAAAHALGWGDTPRASPPEVLAGTLALALALAVLRRLSAAREDADLPTQRTRLGWLWATSAAAIGLALAEFLARTGQPVVDDRALPFLERGLTLQGAIPPISAVVASLSVYLLYHAVRSLRLVALQEVFAHVLVAAGGASVLLVAHFAALQVIALARFPLHGGFSLFLLSAAWLSAWETLRRPLLRRLLGWLEHPGPALDEALERTQRILPGQRDPDTIAARLVGALHGTGRASSVAVWLVDRAGGYRLRAHRGHGHPPGVVGLDPARRDHLTGLLDVVDTDDAGRGLLDLLDADLLLPLRDGDAILGWIALRHAAFSDGFTAAERSRLLRVAELAGRVLGNVEALARMAEEQRLAAVGALSAGLAHEIRNPLAGLKGAAQVLRDGRVDEEDREMLDVVVDETDRLDKVVAAFLDYARPMAPQRRPTDVVELVERVLRLVRVAAGDARPAPRREGGDALPAAGVDGDRLAQVLLNLIRNAQEATGPAGEVVVRLTRLEDHTLQISVRDDGPGLPEEVRDRLFTPFVTTKTSGTGLGLAISQRIIEAHGGWIDALDRLGGGTTMVVTLPHVLQDGAPVGGASDRAPVAGSSGGGSSTDAPATGAGSPGT